jgi:pimeloyl-ACP methyl ester carboxylesterase
MTMQNDDDHLIQFEAEGLPLPPGGAPGTVDNDGARIWYAAYGAGTPVVLLHGGMGHSANFAKQIQTLVDAGYRVVVVDSRGQGRSSWDGRAYSYELMGSDVFAVMDRLDIRGAPIVGWSDGACIGLVMAKAQPERIAGVFFFACNVDGTGTFPFEATPEIDRCFSRHVKDYAALSPDPDGFRKMADALQLMQREQPNYTAADLASIAVPVTVALGENEEFIRPEHGRYIAATIPGASFAELPGVSHFAPIQRPALFNAAVIAFLQSLPKS